MTDSIQKGSTDHKSKLPDNRENNGSFITKTHQFFRIQNDYCPKTGYPIYMHPSWKDVRITEKYSVTFQFIGERILLSIPKGRADNESMALYFQEREKVISYMLNPSDYFFELKDYSELEPTHSLFARNQFAQQMKEEQKRLIGFIGYHAPLSVKLAFGVGKHLFGFTIPIMIEVDYQTAVEKAVSYIESFDETQKEKPADSSAHEYDDDGVDVKADSGSHTKIIRSMKPQYAPTFFTADSETLDSEVFDLFDTFEDDLLFYLGKINWEVEGLESKGKYWREHPFKRVFNAIRLVKFDHDTLINDRIKSEVALKKGERKYRSILESIQDGYYEVDLKGNFTFFNQALVEILNTSAERLPGKNYTDFLDKKSINQFKSLFGNVLKTKVSGQLISWEMTDIEKNKKYLEASITLIEDDANTPTGYQGIIRDVTSRTLSEIRARELEVQKLNAEARNKVQNEFLANMSHEIRTPLNGIIGISEILQNTTLNEQQTELLSSLLKESDNLLWTINSILDYSKVDSGSVDLDDIPFNLKVTVEDVVKNLSIQAERKGLTLSLFFPNNTPSQLVGDPTRLRQVFINLIGNAVKFTDAGEIWVTSEVVENTVNHTTFTFRVKDTGIGIPDEKKATIFESFTQVDGTTTRVHGGSGLGTTIAKQIVEIMGGTIGFESEVEKGSTFFFTLTLKKEKPIETPIKLNNETLEGLHVLLVDQNRKSREMLSDYLNSWGCIPIAVSDVKKALSIVKTLANETLSLDLVIIDTHVTDIDAFEFSIQMRKQSKLDDIPIVLLATSGEIGDGKRCREIGIEGYLIKPITQDHLKKVIQMVLWTKSDKAFRNYSIPITRHMIQEESLKGFRIMVAEDYVTNQLVAIHHLKTAGYRVDLVENGREAVDAFKKNQYKLIFMDIEMPELDGFEATRQIRDLETEVMGMMKSEKSQLVRTPIIAMTAHGLDDYRDKGISMGMDGYITKPLKKKALLRTVEKWIKKSNENFVEQIKTHNEKPRSSSPPIDWQAALFDFSGEEDRLQKAIQSSIDKIEKQIDTIRDAISIEDMGSIQTQMREMKENASVISANKLTDIATSIEDKAHNGNLKLSSGLVEELEQELSFLRDYSALKSRDRV